MGIGKYFNQAQREALLATALSGVTGMATVGLFYAHYKPLIFLSGVLVAIRRGVAGSTPAPPTS